MVWLVKELDITKLGCPVAHPRFKRRPSARMITAWPSGKTHLSTCGLMFTRSTPGTLARARHVDLVVEVPDVADDRLVLHTAHVLGGDRRPGCRSRSRRCRRGRPRRPPSPPGSRPSPPAGRRSGRSRPRRHGALARKRLRAALADVPVAADESDLPADEDVGGAVDAVDERVTAAVLVVELGLGHRVVHVDGREQQLAPLLHLVEPVDARRRLLGHAPYVVGDLAPASRVLRERTGEQAQDHAQFLALRTGGIGHGTGLFELDSLVHEQGGVPAVVEDHVRARRHPASATSARCSASTPRASRPSRRRRARRGVGRRAAGTDDDRRRGVVLGGEDVAGRPTDLGAESDERLDQHRRLHRHVRASPKCAHPGAAGLGVLAPDRHQAGHLVLGELDLLAAELGKGEVGHLEVEAHAISLSGRPLRGSLLQPVTGGQQLRVLLLLERQPLCGCDLVGPHGLGAEPRLEPVAEPVVLAQPEREADVAQLDAEGSRGARAASAGAAARPARKGGSRSANGAGRRGRPPRCSAASGPTIRSWPRPRGWSARRKPQANSTMLMVRLSTRTSPLAGDYPARRHDPLRQDDPRRARQRSDRHRTARKRAASSPPRSTCTSTATSASSATTTCAPSTSRRTRRSSPSWSRSPRTTS